VLLCQQGEPEEAARMKREVVEKRKKALGEDHPDT
jgi:Tetratricopeptide repeat